MGKVIAGMGMSMSLDGFINDANGSVENLNPDFAEIHSVPYFQEMIQNTGAVIMGKHTYEMVDPFIWATDDYEFQTPIFVLTETPPEKYPHGSDKLGFTFVTDGIESAVAQALKAAGDKDVQVLGASITQQCLNAGLCDELQLNLISVVLGDGLRLLDHLDANKIKLERIKVEAPTSVRTSVTFRVARIDAIV